MTRGTQPLPLLNAYALTQNWRIASRNVGSVPAAGMIRLRQSVRMPYTESDEAEDGAIADVGEADVAAAAAAASSAASALSDGSDGSDD